MPCPCRLFIQLPSSVTLRHFWKGTSSSQTGGQGTDWTSPAARAWDRIHLSMYSGNLVWDVNLNFLFTHMPVHNTASPSLCVSLPSLLFRQLPSLRLLMCYYSCFMLSGMSHGRLLCLCIYLCLCFYLGHSPPGMAWAGRTLGRRQANRPPGMGMPAWLPLPASPFWGVEGIAGRKRQAHRRQAGICRTPCASPAHKQQTWHGRHAHGLFTTTPGGIMA